MEGENEIMDLQKFKFPEIGDMDIAFNVLETDESLLAEAKVRGFYNGNTKENDLFNELFFHGGTLNFKQAIPTDFKVNATRYLKAFMSSWEPSQEEKEAISALLLSELVNI